MPKALAVFSGQQKELGACEIYRASMPLNYLRANSDWETGWTWWWDLQGKGGEALEKLIHQHDLFIFPRMQVKGKEGLGWASDFFQIIQGLGKKIIYEVDDDYTNKYRQVTQAEAVNIAKIADAITVTTPYLKKLMYEETGVQTYVLPNCVSPEQWFEGKGNQRKPFYQNKLVVGLTGSPTHKEDWRVLETVIPKILKDYPNVMLLNMGYTPDYLKDLPNAKYIQPLSYPLYCQVIRGCDIILAPVDPTDGFNMGKSPIKAVEGMAATRKVDNQLAGAAVIATNNPIYSLAIKNNKSGLLVEHTPDGWEAALRELIENTPKRKHLQFQGNKYARQVYDISKEWPRWDRAYRTILAS